MKTQQRFKNKVALITGASSGIGKATANSFAKQGARVILASRNREKLDLVARQIIEAGGADPLVIPTDVSDRDAVVKMVNQVVTKAGKIDYLFNNAGVSHVGPFQEEVFIDNLKQMFEVDLMGSIQVTREVLKIMQKQGSGSIMNMSSVVGRKAFPNFGAYSSIMHAIAGFTDSLRQEVKANGIQVSIIHPALTQTALLDHVDPDRMPPPFKAMTPISSKEVAEAVLRGFHKKKERIIVPSTPKVLLFLDALSPKLGDWMVRMVSKKFFASLLGIYKGRTYHQLTTN